MRVGVFLGVSAEVNIVYTCFFAINPDMNENDKGLWVIWLLCLMPISIIFQLYRGSQFYW